MTNTTLPFGITRRPYCFEKDFVRVRNLLIETFPITGPLFNWEIRRWDGWHSHRETRDPQFESRVCLWELPDGRLVGAAHSEGYGDVHFELHPDYRPYVEEDMLAWAEECLPLTGQDGQRRLSTYVHDYDAPRQRLLEQRGFRKTDDWGMSRFMHLTGLPIPPVEMPPGYILRALRPDDEGEFQRMADMINAGFNRTFHKADEVRNFLTTAPCARFDLHLVAEVEGEGYFASHVGVTFDEANRYGLFEPVCTHPNHLRKGLARLLMIEGLRRLQALGAVRVSVDTGDMIPANGLYDALGFTEAYIGHNWEKVF